MRSELKRTFLAIGPERFERMVDLAIDNITGFRPATGDIRKWIPDPAKRLADDLNAKIAEWKSEYERNKQDPEWQALNAEVSEKFKNAGIKLKGEWEKSR